MFLPPMGDRQRRPASSRLPSHVGHGTSRMKPSNRSRLVSDSASRWRRSMHGAHALELGVVGALAAVAVAGDDVHLGRRARRGATLRALAEQVLPRGVEVEAELVAQRAPAAAGSSRRRGAGSTAGSRPRRAWPRGRGRPARGRPPSGCRGRRSAGQAPKGELNENERGSRSSVSMAWSFGAGHLLAERAARGPGRSASRSTKSSTHALPASRSAVSTESVRRRFEDSFTAEPVDDDLDRVLLLLVELRRLVERCASRRRPGPARTPASAGCRNRSTYSPLRPRITGASTWKRRPPPAPAPGRRSAAASAARWARRTPGSAAGPRGRRAGGGSRRPR